MQTQETTVAQRVIGNKHLASTLRARIRNGNASDSAIVEILNRMTDEELVAQYVAHTKGR